MMLIKKILYWLLPNKEKIILAPNARVGGVIISPLDQRDFEAERLLTSPLVSHSLRPLINRVENQGAYNSCVAQAITTAIECHSKLAGFPHNFELSRMHVWNEAKKLTWGKFKSEWTPNNGCFIRDGWKAVQHEGVTIEKLFRYVPNNTKRNIDGAAKYFLRWHEPFVYRFIHGFTARARYEKIQQALFVHNAPVVFGVRVPKNFLNVNKNVIYKPSADEKTAFAHAMLITGYDDRDQTFEILNSWGTRWGDRGFLRVDAHWILTKGFDFSYATEVQ